MRVLVAAATKHGATGEIAQAIADTLRDQGLDPAVLEPERVDTIDGYDAVVLGSAVYAGHWLKPARDSERLCRPWGSPDGDFRDWPEITGWAAGIATALRSSPDPEGGS